MSIRSFFNKFRRSEPTPVPEEKVIPLLDESGVVIDDPILTRIVNEAWRTGKPVIWDEGDGR